MVKWDRLAESKSVVLFATTSVIQAVVLICLQLRIFTRNVYGWLNLNSELGGAADSCLYSGTFDSFMILTFESVMFIFLYLFQLYVCISAILHKNTIQVFMIALTNFCYVVLGVVQLIETKETHNKILNDCPMIAFDPEFMIPRYRTRLIFLMLLKLNLLMILLFSILIVPYSINGSEKTLVYVDFIFFMSVSLFNALAYKSITNEYKNGMNSFLTFWVIAMAVYGWFFYIGFSLTFAYKLYIGSIFGIFFLLLGVLTFVIGISVTKNFGKGLKEYLTIHKSGIKKIEEYEYKYDNNHNSNSNNNNI
ncbi:hypothetical protein RhiirA1_424460 [Rhizophagus irregularis]|uniref:Chitin synthase export chaperone n=1 Tax=Rhizophagus irregularis TaxID=588596 RepID=A0A2N0REU9_9GLOM|nr:hypothetical protein RhiirA1_424460 [Rhizophagus irregularis]